MNGKAVAGLVAGALVVGLLVGLGIGGNGNAKEAAGPGPRTTRSGVPVGYQRSRDGAVQAALSYSDALAAALNRSPEERREIVQAMAPADKAESIFSELGNVYRLLDKALGSSATSVASYGVLGYHVQAFDRTVAEISLWEVSVFGSASAGRTDAGWSTTLVKLRWNDGDWKLDSMPVGVDGPTPALRGAPSDAAQLIDSAKALSAVRHASD